jgi:DNA invertase Pin-like site-specific DNA recombinase
VSSWPLPPGRSTCPTPAGRTIARTLGTAARHEAEHKAERQARERQQAKAGRPHSSGTRGYGYADDKVTIVGAEAAVIRAATSAGRECPAGRTTAGPLRVRQGPW